MMNRSIIKATGLAVVAMLLFAHTFAQVTRSTRLYKRPFDLEYAVVQNEKLFTIGDSLARALVFIREYSLAERKLPLLTNYPAFTWYTLPMAWDVIQPHVFSLSVFGGRDHQTLILERFDLGTVDSLDIVKSNQKSRKEFQEKYGHLPEEEQINIALQRSNQIVDRENLYSTGIPVLYDYMREFQRKDIGKSRSQRMPDDEYYSLFTIDIQAIDSSQVLLYLRDKNQLSVWHLSIPSDWKSLAFRADSREHWNELITYVRDSVTTFPDPLSNRLFPSKEKMVFNSIADSMFFKGHFKVIAQGNDRFAINLNHGAIYHLGDKQVQKVGQIDMAGYNRKLLGKKRFVNNKDKGEIVFFSKVRKITDPFPKIRLILSDKEFSAMFGNVISK